MVGALARMRRVLNAGGDNGGPIWVTEVGWATSGPPSVFTVNRRRQAQLIGNTVPHACAQAQFPRPARCRGLHAPRLAPGPADHDYWGFHAGLFDLKGQSKPLLAALRQAARGVRS
jgi:hypothetical protein